MHKNWAYYVSFISFCLLAMILFFNFGCTSSLNQNSGTNLLAIQPYFIGYFYDNYSGQGNYTLVCPAKIIVTGGSPNHPNGDYHFSLSSLSHLPAGVAVDFTTGVLKGSGAAISTAHTFESFSLDITDGSTTISKEFYFNIAHVPSGYSAAVPEFAFLDQTPSKPFGGLPDAHNSQPYGVALGVWGESTPPYSFAVSSGTLPGGLTLGETNGVISGTVQTNISKAYTFEVTCTDSNGDKAITTGGFFQKYTITVK